MRPRQGGFPHCYVEPRNFLTERYDSLLPIFDVRKNQTNRSYLNTQVPTPHPHEVQCERSSVPTKQNTVSKPYLKSKVKCCYDFILLYTHRTPGSRCRLKCIAIRRSRTCGIADILLAIASLLLRL